MGGDCIQCEQVSRTHLRRRLFQNGSRQPVERDAGEQLQVCVCVGGDRLRGGGACEVPAAGRFALQLSRCWFCSCCRLKVFLSSVGEFNLPVQQLIRIQTHLGHRKWF